MRQLARVRLISQEVLSNPYIVRPMALAPMLFPVRIIAANGHNSIVIPHYLQIIQHLHIMENRFH